MHVYHQRTTLPKGWTVPLRGARKETERDMAMRQDGDKLIFTLEVPATTTQEEIEALRQELQTCLNAVITDMIDEAIAEEAKGHGTGRPVGIILRETEP